MHHRRHPHPARGIVAPVLVFGIFILLLIFGTSGMFIGTSLWKEVSSAEAGQTVRLGLESSLEEAIQGFILSVNMTEEDARSPSDQAKLMFARAIRGLGPGEVAHARFVPRNTRKAAQRLGVELGPVEVILFNEGATESDGEAAKASCKKLKEVLEKWSKIPG